jgi:Cdc6-like AAA superfamily ATPase
MNKSTEYLRDYTNRVKDFEKETKFNGYTKEQLEDIYYKRKASFQ